MQQQQPLQEARHRAAAQFRTKADVQVLGISLFIRNGMAVDVFEVDQLSICLLVGILLVLALVKYQQYWDQPLLHPLILARQAETSQVHAPKESATYRNINAPLGFDLAMRPQRFAPDVASLLALGVTGAEGEHARRVLDMSLTNLELRRQATAFAYGLQDTLQGATPIIAVYGRLASARSLIALLAGAVSGLPITTYVVPDGAQATQLPDDVDFERAVLVRVDATEPVPPALALCTLSVVANTEEPTPGVLSATRTLHFDDVLGQTTNDTPAACDHSTLRSNELDAVGARTFATFYDPDADAWVRATHTSMTSGVTAWLSEYPPEKIPGMHDTLLTDAFLAGELSAPAYVSLALTALYTGAAFSSEPSTEVLSLARVLKPTLLYLSARAAFHVEFSLWLPSTGALLHSLAYRVNTFVLRNGRFTRNLWLDKWVAAPLRRALGFDTVRATYVLSSGAEIDQTTLDQLRLYLAGPVMHAYVPHRLSDGATAAVVTAPVAASNMYDLQAFAPQLVDGASTRRLAPHVGPPAVTMEVKLVENTPAVQKHAAALARLALDETGTRDDPVGEVYVRGYALAHATTENIARDSTLSGWFATGDVGTFRTNGTLVIVAAHDAEQAGVAPDFTLDPSGDPLPELRAPQPRRAAKSMRTTASRIAVAPVALAMLALCVAPLVAAVDTLGGTHPLSRERLALVSHAQAPQELERRAKINTTQASTAASSNSTMYNMALNSLLTAQRASWEQGVTQSAILETYYPEWSVYHKTSGDLYPKKESASAIPSQLLSLAYHSIAAQDRNGRLATVVTGDESTSQGAALDSASCGEGVLIGAWIIEGFVNNQPDPNGFWGGAAHRQLDYVLHNVSRSSNGVISQRAARNVIQLWSDQTYMGPPFLAHYALITNNVTLFNMAFDQLEGVHNGLLLRDGTGKGLWGHIVDYSNVSAPRWIDDRAWLTGNAWAAAGMLRVMAASMHSSDSGVQQRGQALGPLVDSIFDTAYPFIDQNTGLFHNVVNDTRTFLDGSGSALMAYAVFRYGSMVPSKRDHISMAEKTYQTLQKSLDPYGSYTNNILTVNELSTASPGPTSTESLAFLAMLASARRDYYAGNVTGSDGGVDAPEGSTAADQGSDSNAGVPSRAGPWAALAALGTAWVAATLIAM